MYLSINIYIINLMDDTALTIDYHFPVIHQYWMDSGLLGFYTLAKENEESYPKVKICADETGVHLRGSQTDLESFLYQVYEVLLQKYYNTSTEKQQEERAGFYYDTKKDNFERFHKVKARGIAEVIFNKAPRPTKDSVAYVKGTHRLPDPYTGLQERFDTFLSENNLKADGKTFLIDGGNKIHPKVNISLVSKKPIATCRLCGRKIEAPETISGTVFPLITGSSGVKSFISGCEKVDVVCWACNYVAKFVPVVGHYSMSSDSTYIFLLYSQSFPRMINVMPSLASITSDKEPLFPYQNYDGQLGSYFQHSYEQFFSFLYTVYQYTLTLSQGNRSEVGLDALYKFLNDLAPISFYVLHVRKLGQSFVGKLVWNFTESVYLFRLLKSLSNSKEEEIDIKKVMWELVDSDQPKRELKTLVRNKVCERILKKQQIMDILEQFVYHVCRSETKFIKSIYDFTIAYERILAGEDSMKQKLINTAVSLGKTLGLTLGIDGKKARGDLFQLRKTRRLSDFLNEVNRIQMKYGVSVTADLYNLGEELDQNFAEFKQFCMIAALNSFNSKVSEKKTSGE